MKLSISLPNPLASEIKAKALESEKSISYWIRKAWLIAKPSILREPADLALQKEKALKRLDSLKGKLKPHFPQDSSVSLAHRAFTDKH